MDQIQNCAGKPTRRAVMRWCISYYSILYFVLQILTKRYYRTPLIRYLIDSEKYKKNFIVYNNNKMIRAWYLSSGWPVCRFMVNRTARGTGGAKLSAVPKTRVFEYCALLCNRVAKIEEQIHFCPFSELFPFQLETKISDLFIFFSLFHQIVGLYY